MGYIVALGVEYSYSRWIVVDMVGGTECYLANGNVSPRFYLSGVLGLEL